MSDEGITSTNKLLSRRAFYIVRLCRPPTFFHDTWQDGRRDKRGMVSIWARCSLSLSFSRSPLKHMIKIPDRINSNFQPSWGWSCDNTSLWTHTSSYGLSVAHNTREPSSTCRRMRCPCTWSSRQVRVIFVFLHFHYILIIHFRYLASGGYDSIVNMFDLNDWICARTITVCEWVEIPLTFAYLTYLSITDIASTLWVFLMMANILPLRTQDLMLIL